MRANYAAINECIPVLFVLPLFPIAEKLAASQQFVTVHISVYRQQRGRLVKQLVACQQRTALAAVWLQWPWDSLLLLAPFTNHSPLHSYSCPFPSLLGICLPLFMKH